MSKPANRLLTLILLLQRQPNQKAADLAHSLGVSVRTLHRYIEMLDEMGIPVYSERGIYGGFSLVRGYKMPPLVFTPQEAAAVSLGTGLVEEMWGTVYREAARSARAKLDNLLPEQQLGEVKWARKRLVTAGVAQPWMDALGTILEKLRHAMRTSHQIKIVYASTSAATPSTRELDPYAIAFRWGWWYVIGYCHLRGEVRTFRVDRIETLSETEDTFAMPVEFDVQAYMAQAFQTKNQVQVQMRFKAEAARIALNNRPAWDMCEQQADGSVVVKFSVPDLNWAASSVLAYGPAAEVLEPPELGKLLKEWASVICELYSSKGF